MKPTPASHPLAAAALALLVVVAPLAGCRRSARPIGIPLKATSQFENEMGRYRGFDPHKASSAAKRRSPKRSRTASSGGRIGGSRRSAASTRSGTMSWRTS
jgi:hypothetical protein